MRLDLNPLRRLLRKLRSKPVPRDVGKQWAVRYSAFARRRFTKEGDGEWAPLAASTLAKRRKQGKGAKILRDTSTLLNALSIGTKGNYLKPLRNGIRFGFSNALHSSGRKTIRQIAIYHETGAGRNPKRVILAAPDQKTVEGMGQDFARHIDKLGRRYGGRARGR